MEHTDGMANNLPLIPRELPIDVNDITINACDLCFGHKPVTESHRIEIVNRETHRHRRRISRFPGDRGQRAVSKGCGHPAMEESHAVAMALQHPQPHLQLVANTASINRPVMQRKWPAASERFLESVRDWIRIVFCHLSFLKLALQLARPAQLSQACFQTGRDGSYRPA